MAAPSSRANTMTASMSPSFMAFTMLLGTSPITKSTPVALAFAAGGELLFEQVYAPLPDGAWLGKRLHVNLKAAPELFGNKRSEWIAVFSNHKRFDVGVEQKIETPVQ